METENKAINTEPPVTTEKNEGQTATFRLSRVVGYILLSPALISVVLFFIQLIQQEQYEDLKYFVSSAWTGKYGYDTGGGGYTSALPFYFGLMAIAGAYLIKDSSKK